MLRSYECTRVGAKHAVQLRGVSTLAEAVKRLTRSLPMKSNVFTGSSSNSVSDFDWVRECVLVSVLDLVCVLLLACWTTALVSSSCDCMVVNTVLENDVFSTELNMDLDEQRSPGEM